MTHLLKFTEQVKWHIKPLALEQTDAPWSQSLCRCVADFSAFILQQSQLRAFPEIIALAYWFRAAHLKQLAEQVYQQGICLNEHKTQHKVFHIAPANVDTVFLYSVLLSVLSGNQNIVRVSERSGDITWLLIELIKEYLKTPQGQILRPYIAINLYSAQQQGVTEQLSHWCDLRVIWGGDNAIEAISEIAPQTKQICFPDRYSIAVLNLTAESDINHIAQHFLTDILPFNQQACSSPKAIYWLNTTPDIQAEFWRKVKTLLKTTEHQLGLSNKVEQHILLQKLAAAYAVELNVENGEKIASFAKIQSVGQLGHCKVKKLSAEMLAEHSGNGLVFEVDIASTSELPYSKKLQTISYAGIHPLPSLKFEGLHKRTVQLGKALAFDSTWDGVDLIQTFL